jgi:hypothetical protein
MNSFNHSEDDDIKNLLEETANQIEPNAMFVAQLENKLKQNHLPKKGFNMLTLKKITSVIAWAGALTVLVITVNWFASQMAPKENTPASLSTESTEFICPVTIPNGSLPPNVTKKSPYYFGNDNLWTTLWLDGKIHVKAADKEPDNSVEIHWAWWYADGLTGELIVEGHRLDEQAERLHVGEIKQGPDNPNLLIAYTSFPTSGCWEVTARMGDSSLTFVTEIVEDEEILPTISPAGSPVPFLESNSLIFGDNFANSLDKNWEWLYEDKNNWSLTNNPGWLEINAGYGFVNGGNIENLLVRPMPEGNFEMETRLKFNPIEKMQFAGLIVFENGANHIQFGHGFCHAPSCTDDGIYFQKMSRGSWDSENFDIDADHMEIVYLRLRRKGNNFTAYISQNGTDWLMIGTHTAEEMNEFSVGLISGQSFNRDSRPPAQFDYFVINSLP